MIQYFCRFLQILAQRSCFLVRRHQAEIIIIKRRIQERNSSSSSSSLFQSQRSLKSQLNRKRSMLTIIFTGNREEAK